MSTFHRVLSTFRNIALILTASGLVHAQVPVSGLPQATLPLTGNESVVMNQNGTTKQGKVSSITSLVTLSQATGITLTPNPIVGGTGTIGLTIPVAVTSGGTGALTLSGLIVGNGTGPFTGYAGATCTNQFLRSLSSTGSGTCNSVSLATDVTGNLSVNNLNSGTGASASTYWSGAGTWAQVNLASGVTGNLSVNNLNSGTGASASTVWTGNGTWAAPAGGITGLANPSGLVGLTAVNGVATTATRSDATHALDQSISPTWTGTHGFNGTYVTSTGTTLVSPGQQGITFINSAGGTNAKIWDIIQGTANHLTFRAVNDAFGSAGNWLDVTRSGLALSSLSFGNATDNPTYTFQGSGATSVGGTFTSAGNITVTAGNITSNTTTSGQVVVNTTSTTTGQFVQTDVCNTVHCLHTLNTTVNQSTPFIVNAPSAESALLYTDSNTSLCLGTQSNCRLVIDGSGNITAPGAGTVPWANCTTSTWSATPTGFSSVTSQTFKYTVCSKLVTVVIPAFTGTSNATTFGVGGVPAAIQPASAVTGHCGGFEDNGTLFLEGTVVPSGSTLGFAIWAVSGTRIQENQSGWTNTGTKGLNQGCSFTYSTQ